MVKGQLSSQLSGEITAINTTALYIDMAGIIITNLVIIILLVGIYKITHKKN